MTIHNDDLREPSICIPRVHKSCNKEYIKEILEKNFQLGNIAKVEQIFMKNEKHYNRVFVHFKKWNIQKEEIRQKLINEENIKIVHDGIWFWKCFKSKFSRPAYID